MDNTTAHPWHSNTKGLIILVRLTPRGGRDSIDGTGMIADGRSALFVRVRPPPENGAANQALVKLLAKAIDIPASSVKIVSGHTSRLKSLHLSGDIEMMQVRLTNLLGEDA